MDTSFLEFVQNQVADIIDFAMNMDLDLMAALEWNEKYAVWRVLCSI